MITASDSINTVDLGRYYAILPSGSESYTLEQYCRERRAKPVPEGFAYDSGTNPDFLSVGQLRELIGALKAGPRPD